MTTHAEQNSITWLQFNNIVPIIVTVVGIVLSFAAWTTRVSVLETKLDLVIIKQDELLDKYAQIENKYDGIALIVRGLEVTHDK